jgi:hypothetical protein
MRNHISLKSGMAAALVVAASVMAAPADQLRVATICAGAATLDNGSIVTIGQPFVGFMSSAGGETSLQAGILPTLGFTSYALPSAPVITSGGWQASGTFGFGFATQPNRNYVVEASTNLTLWSPIWTNTATDASLLFEDPNTANFVRRFYRVMAQ